MSLASPYFFPPNPHRHEERQPGHDLFDQIKQLEKSDKDNKYSFFQQLESIIETMKRRIATVACRGILQGDIELAEQIIKNKSNQSKKGKKQQDTNETNDKDTDLFLKAILKMIASDETIFVTLACDYCTAYVRFLTTNGPSDSPCYIAEYEIIASAVKDILNEIQKAIGRLLDGVDRDYGFLFAFRRADKDLIAAIVAAFRAATAFGALFGTKLSRNSTVKDKLYKSAIAVLSCDDEALVNAAARFLAVLPGTGSTQGKDPWDIWNTFTQDAMNAIWLWIEYVTPSGAKSQKEEEYIPPLASIESEVLRGNLKLWLLMMDSFNEEQERVRFAQMIVKSLVSHLSLLLTGHSFDTKNSTSVGMSLSVSNMQKLLRRMCCFDSSSERIFFNTKKRLRSEVIEGEVSVLSNAESFAPTVKALGLDLFITFIRCLRSNEALPEMRSLLTIAKDAFVSSCPSVMRFAIDPTFSMNNESKRQKWLHSSLKIRALSLQCLGGLIASHGLDPHKRVAVTGSAYSSIATGEELVDYICGCALEQCALEKDIERWGASAERIGVLKAATACLSNMIGVGGAFFSIESRNMIEVTAEVLISLASKETCTFDEEATCNALDLLHSCATTPWQDGSRSDILQRAAHHLHAITHFYDERTKYKAEQLLGVRSVLSNTRSPALKTILRTDEVLDTLSRTLGRFDSSTENYIKLFKFARKRIDDEEESRKKRKVDEGVNPIPTREQLSRISEVGMHSTGIEQPKSGRPIPEKIEKPFGPNAKVRHDESIDKGKSIAAPQAKDDSDSDDEDIPMIVDSVPDKEDR